MSDKKIYTINPGRYTSSPHEDWDGIPASSSGWFHGTAHRYKYDSGTSSNNKLTTDDGVDFDARYDLDGSYGSWEASGNPCSSSGFSAAFKTNTNTPGYFVCVIANGTRSNLKSWNTSSISSSDQSNAMTNVIGCTFKSDNTASDDSNSPKIYVRNMAFLYRSPSGSPYCYTLKNKLSGVEHFDVAHRRDTKIQGGYIDRSKLDSRYTFHGIVVQYWTTKNTGTTGRLFKHKIKNLKFIVGNSRTPSTSSYGSDRIVLQSGTGNHGSNIKIWTT